MSDETLTQQVEDMPTVDLVAALKRVLALHVPIEDGLDKGFCCHCGFSFPCRTVRAVSGDLS